MSELTKTKEPNETTLMQQNERIFVPRVDIVENDDVVLLIADMPGVSADSGGHHAGKEHFNHQGRDNTIRAGRLRSGASRVFDRWLSACIHAVR